MTIRFRRLDAIAIALVLAAIVVPPGGASEVPDLLSYQGRLFDATGKPVTATIVMRFTIYRGGDATSNPSTGVPVHREDAAIDPDEDGLFTHLIGSGTPVGICDTNGDGEVTEPCSFGPSIFPDGSTPLFVEVRTDPAGQNNILLPRQRLASSGYAMRAARLDTLSAAQISALLPPVGAVIPFFGAAADLPPNWKICDGTVVSDFESPLNGVAVPDLRSRFLRGESDVARDIPVAGINSGGSDTLPSSTASGTLPTHTHPLASITGRIANSGSDPCPGGTSGTACAYNMRDDGGWTNNCRVGVGNCSGVGDENNNWEGHHYHELGGNTSNASNTGGHTHSLGGDNRPAFRALHFIIRIK